jgi:hypothetical protein
VQWGAEHPHPEILIENVFQQKLKEIERKKAECNLLYDIVKLFTIPAIHNLLTAVPKDVYLKTTISNYYVYKR